MENRNCVVAFANGKGNYVNALARLHESLRNNMTNADFLGYIGEKTIDSPLHTAVPYAFKIYAIRAAIKAGYTSILYLDTSCFAVKNIDICFDEINRNGFLFQDSGHKASTWINDYSLNYFGITREQARDIPLIGNAGMLGLNFNHGRAQKFFNIWERSMHEGCFNGRWVNNEKTESLDEECRGHRHDMVSGIILHQMGLTKLAKEQNEWLQYAGVFDEVANETIIFKAQGM